MVYSCMMYGVCYMLTLSRGTDTSFSLTQACPTQVEHGPLECIFDRPEKDSATWEDSLGMDQL